MHKQSKQPKSKFSQSQKREMNRIENIKYKIAVHILPKVQCDRFYITVESRHALQNLFDELAHDCNMEVVKKSLKSLFEIGFLTKYSNRNTQYYKVDASKTPRKYERTKNIHYFEIDCSRADPKDLVEDEKRVYKKVPYIDCMYRRLPGSFESGR